jgi:hypothetical protein
VVKAYLEGPALTSGIEILEDVLLLLVKLEHLVDDQLL